MSVVLLSGRNKITAPSLHPIDACSALCSSLTKYSVPDISSIQIPLLKIKPLARKTRGCETFSRSIYIPRDRQRENGFTVYLYSA